MVSRTTAARTKLLQSVTARINRGQCYAAVRYFAAVRRATDTGKHVDGLRVEFIRRVPPGVCNPPVGQNDLHTGIWYICAWYGSCRSPISSLKRYQVPPGSTYQPCIYCTCMSFYFGTAFLEVCFLDFSTLLTIPAVGLRCMIRVRQRVSVNSRLRYLT